MIHVESRNARCVVRRLRFSIPLRADDTHTARLAAPFNLELENDTMALNRRNGTLTIALLLGLTGCGDAAQDGARATKNLEGRVESEGSFEGATVDAHEVSSNGETVAESNPEGEGATGADGAYSVAVDVRADVDTTVVVEATLGAIRRAALVTSDFSADAAVTVEPMNEETTFEADVYVRALAEGLLCDDCSSAIVLDFIGAAAADAHASNATEASLDASAEINASAAETFVEAMVASTTETEASVRTAIEAHAEARRTRALSLDAAVDASAREGAEDDYLDAVVSAYVEAGVDLDAQSAAVQAAAEDARARIDASATLDVTMRAALRADVEKHSAVLVTWATEAHAEATGASRATLEAAGDTLRASLEASATAGASAEAQVDAAWLAYRASVRAELRAALTAGEQVAFDAAVSALEAAAEATHTTLEASFTLTNDVSTWIEPLLAFSISGDAQVNALVSAGSTEASASAMVKVLIAVELATH